MVFAYDKNFEPSFQPLRKIYEKYLSQNAIKMFPKTTLFYHLVNILAPCGFGFWSTYFFSNA